MKEKIKKCIRAIRNITPLPIKSLIYRSGMYFGFELPEVYPSIQASLTTLKKRGFSAQNCIDVGAYNGEWTDAFKAFFHDSKILMIEPQANKEKDLKSIVEKYKGSVSYELALLSANAGEEVTFHEMGTGSSILSELSSYSRVDVKMKTKTLDNLLEKYKDYNTVDFLKIDTQGYELEILKGGVETLKKTKVLLLEVSIVPCNEGGPLISDIFDFLNRRGFRLFDFCSQMRRKDGVLVQTDLMFLNEKSGLIPQP